MTKQAQKNGPAGAQTETQDRSHTRAKDENRDVKPQGKDEPGADGPLSAGAEEDTYD